MEVPFVETRHEPVFTSEEAARVRGTPLESGAKALVCKTGEEFMMLVLPASSRLNSKKVRQSLGLRELRFATREEVVRLTTLQPGSIPPFGSLFRLTTWCDQKLQLQPNINFNAGDHSISLSMSIADYLQIEKPRIGDFGE